MTSPVGFMSSSWILVDFVAFELFPCLILFYFRYAFILSVCLSYLERLLIGDNEI